MLLQLCCHVSEEEIGSLQGVGRWMLKGSSAHHGGSPILVALSIFPSCFMPKGQTAIGLQAIFS